jgi:hypothetical protein
VEDDRVGEKRLGAFCKSFRPDFDHLSLLLNSFAMHNPDGLVLTLSLPLADITAFHHRFGRSPPNVVVVPDEEYCGRNLGGLPGWFSQQVCKLTSWRVVEAERYVLLDSDCYLIRDIKIDEFRPRDKRYLVFGSLVRTVLKEDNVDLLKYIRGEIDPASVSPKPWSLTDSLSQYLDYRTRDLENPGPIERSDIPMKAFGAKQWVYYQPGQIFCRDVIVALMDYLKERNLTPVDLIRISPWENNWYGEFIASRYFAETEFRISPFVHFQEEADILFARRLGLTESELAKRFVFVNMAARHLKYKRFDAVEPVVHRVG